MSWILRKFKHRQGENHETTFMMRNGESVLKELMAASKGKYNPYRIFSAKELKAATNNYDQQKLITEYYSYKLYKGSLRERQISVMKYVCNNDWTYEACINNVVYASQMSHKHIIKLIGCCLETEIPILVYESVGYGTLWDRLHGAPRPHSEPLLLTHRLKIAMDIANAVAYLHVGFPRPIVFRDVNPYNILLTEDNVLKLFDFSLSKSIPEGETYVKGTLLGSLLLEYTAPECLPFGNCNEKYDVFSFGAVLLEILTGQKAYDIDRADCFLIDYVKKYIENDRFSEVIAPIIVEDGSYPGNKRQLQDFVQFIFECVNESPEVRPTMVDVAKKLRQIFKSVAQSSNLGHN